MRGIDFNFLSNYPDCFFEVWAPGYKSRYSEEAIAVIEVDYQPSVAAGWETRMD